MAANAMLIRPTLKVPSVQELAKKNLASIPKRFVRSDLPKSNTNSETEIPVIDMQKLLSEDDLTNSELQKFDSACKEWGYFQLINHGVSTSLLEKLKLQIQYFFDLPLEEKRQLDHDSGALEGFGQSYVLSEEQKLDWSDMFSMVMLPTYLRNTQLFPKLPAQLSETLDAYSAEMKSLGMEILYQMAKALGMKPEEVTELFDEGMQSLRMNYYPPCPEPELAIGIRPHADCGGLTILFQVSDVDGLQVQKDGTWVPVVPLPNALIVNSGDILEILTNGIYKSAEHRATVNTDKSRLTVATFLSPKADCIIAPASSLITPQTPARFKSNHIVGHFKGCFAPIPGEKSYVDSMRI